MKARRFSVASRSVPPLLAVPPFFFVPSLNPRPHLSFFPSFNQKTKIQNQEPGSPCRNFVAQIREQQKGIAESTCANPVTVSTKPTAQCCELALTFTPCKCDDDVARVSGRMLAIATYRATQFACQGKCVEPQSVGCKGK